MVESFAIAVPPVRIVDLALLTLLVMTAIAMIRLRSLFSVIMLSGIYSLVSAAFFIALDAVDVAFTEAAVGAGISTVLMLSGVLLTARQEKLRTVQTRAPIAFITVLVVGGGLFYATIDMPPFGDPTSPANTHVGKAYIDQASEDVAVPNIVTAVLASYRGFDTLGEVLVVFTAGLAVMLLLGGGGGSAVSARKKSGHADVGEQA